VAVQEALLSLGQNMIGMDLPVPDQPLDPMTRHADDVLAYVLAREMPSPRVVPNGR
jgi:hypothetical protein